MATIARHPNGAGASSGVPLLLRLYPAAWRKRYGAEFAELLSARPPDIRDRFDIVLGAIDARVNPQLPTSTIARTATAVDRLLALAGVTTGVLFAIWGGLLAVASPRWGSMEMADEGLVAISYGAGFIGVVIGIGVLLGLAHRHLDELGSVGSFGALLAAAGLLFSVANAAMLGILMATAGTLALAPALARVVHPAIAAMLAAGTAFLFLGMFGFVGSGGQDVFWLFMLPAYGPTWALLGFGLRHGRPTGSTETEMTAA